MIPSIAYIPPYLHPPDSYFRADVAVMLYRRYVLALIQRKVMCSGAGGETFEHAMLGELYLHPTTANLES